MEHAQSLPVSFGRGLLSTRVRFLQMMFSVAGLLCLLPQIAAQDQTGFISIDCGSNSNYTETRDKTGLIWTTDDAYITTGINKVVSTSSSGQTERLQQLSTARYFQESRPRKKYCYILPVKANFTYLIRATFFYGNLDVPPPYYSFNSSIDTTDMGVINITDPHDTRTDEYIWRSTSQQIAFCLSPVVGSPFISSLELRPLPATMYGGLLFQLEEPLYMELYNRWNVGPYSSSTSATVRFPDDFYDRIWQPILYSMLSTGTPISTDANLTIGGLYDNPPRKVMQSAREAESIPFIYYDVPEAMYYATLYFQEIAELNSTDTRVLDVLLNDQKFSRSNNFSVRKVPDELYSNDAEFYSIASPNINFTLTRHRSSTLPPILNGAELYCLYDTTTNTTDPAEVAVLNRLRESLKLLDWTGDPCLPVPWDWLNCSSDEFPRITGIYLSGYGLNGTIPTDVANLTNLRNLWLDSNYLTGPIPDLSDLKNLKTLHLQDNSLNGSIPTSLADIPNLSELFLTDNKLSGPVPPALLQKKGLNLQVDTASSKSKTNGALIGAIVGIVAFGIIIVLCICLFRWRRAKREVQPGVKAADYQIRQHKSEVELGLSESPLASRGSGGVQITKAFSQAEVRIATDNFGREIGKGGFGPVYYGRLENGNEVAVKLNSDTSSQGSLEFSTEVSLLSRVHHRNLVSLVGFCDEGNARILIYEFMQNGTLREHLYGKGVTTAMDWKSRLDVALNAARGLEYLHYDCNPRIIHRDVKSTNVLLNGKMLAKVADFGISRSTPDEDTTKMQTDSTSKVQGTFGYMDPEYFYTHKLTYKSDVYAFGVVLLELISGRPPIDQQLLELTEHPSLIEYARQMLFASNLDAIVDPFLKGNNYSLDAMWKLAELAMNCVEPVSKNRPDMRQLVQELTEAVQFEETEYPLPAISTTVSSASTTYESSISRQTSDEPILPSTGSSRSLSVTSAPSTLLGAR